MLSIRKPPRGLEVVVGVHAAGYSSSSYSSSQIPKTLQLCNRCSSSYSRARTSAYKSPSLSSSHHQRRVLFTSEQISPSPLPRSSIPGAASPSALLPVRTRFPVMATLTHARSHAGHSHHHHGHSHDNTYLTSTNKSDAGVRVTRLGLYVNLGMAVSKGVGGVYFNSQALLADAFHALTDIVSDFMTLATISVALKPPTLKYPNGYGKVESFGSLMVSGLLLTGGLLMCANAGTSLYATLLADAAQHAHQLHHHAAEAAGEHAHGIFHSHSHSAKDMIPNLNAAWLAGGSIIVKEYLYRITMKIAKERKSSVLASNAVHHRVDSLTSIVALVAIGGSHVLNGATWLDPVGGLIVSLMVIQAGLGNTIQAINELCDVSIDDEVKGSIKEAAAGVLRSKEAEVRSVSGIKAGQNYLVDLELAVPTAWTLSQMQSVEETVRKGVGSKVRGARRIRIRFTPVEKGSDDFQDEFIGADSNRKDDPEPKDAHDRSDSHRHDHDHSHANTNPTSNGSAHKRR